MAPIVSHGHRAAPLSPSDTWTRQPVTASVATGTVAILRRTTTDPEIRTDRTATADTRVAITTRTHTEHAGKQPRLEQLL
ncbi:hypothetical protein GCM10022222_70370 [Amycolatopsis ultiminotia]|uniref:Uncharacterized protein n=1 Tax=Amycolatopsis ultiminotia TaxID=543629 RepID=A0ABP6Y0Y2_9PSEU